MQARLPQPHPDAERATRRMPYEQLRSLVVSIIEPELLDLDDLIEDDPDAAVREFEFETQRTTCLPGPRTSTLDQLIAALPRYERFPRGSSAHLPPERVPTDRAAAYIPRAETIPDRPAGSPPPPPRPRGRSRAGGDAAKTRMAGSAQRSAGGRGSQRR